MFLPSNCSGAEPDARTLKHCQHEERRDGLVAPPPPPPPPPLPPAAPLRQLRTASRNASCSASSSNAPFSSLPPSSCGGGCSISYEQQRTTNNGATGRREGRDAVIHRTMHVRTRAWAQRGRRLTGSREPELTSQATNQPWPCHLRLLLLLLRQTGSPTHLHCLLRRPPRAHGPFATASPTVGKAATAPLRHSGPSRGNRHRQLP